MEAVRGSYGELSGKGLDIDLYRVKGHEKRQMEGVHSTGGGNDIFSDAEPNILQSFLSSKYSLSSNYTSGPVRSVRGTGPALALIFMFVVEDRV